MGLMLGAKQSEGVFMRILARARERLAGHGRAAGGRPGLGRYSGEQLRKIRAARGVGRPPKVFMCAHGPATHRGMMQAFATNEMAARVDCANNLYEWVTKPRKAAR